MQLPPARYDPVASDLRPVTDSAPPQGKAPGDAADLRDLHVWCDDHAFDERAAGRLELLAGCDADVIAVQEVRPRLPE